ncbi:MAG: prepilin peptidase [Betaproteobacteria bacterium]|nr:prepilin peptidase [Betaproteobacteria bacterium]
MEFIIAAGLFGLLLGSFLNVAAHRLPQMRASGIVRRGKPLGFLALPLSHCPHCQTPIPPYYNIPLLSFLWLRGRARCCQKPINRCYPLVEAGGALICVAAAVRFGKNLDFIFAVIFLSMLLLASLIDMRKYFLLDVLTLPLLWLGLLINVDSRFALLPDAVLGAAGGYLGMRVLAAAGAAIFRQTAIGGGDLKLMAALGAWLGWQPLPLLLFFGCIIGLGGALVLHGGRRAARWQKNAADGRSFLRVFAKGRFSFGPALSLSGALMLFYGDTVIAEYWLFIGGSLP